MTAVSAHELQRVVICKEFGCENEVRRPVIERGPYAGRCDEHYEVMRAKMGAAQQKRYAEQPSLASVTGLDRVEPSRNGHKPAGSLKEAAQACVVPAGDLDKALTRKASADGEAQRARDALAAALRALQAAVQDVAA